MAAGPPSMLTERCAGVSDDRFILVVVDGILALLQDGGTDCLWHAVAAKTVADHGQPSETKQ